MLIIMDVLGRLHNCGIVPVVVIDNAKNAVQTANALLSGDVDVMEITFRTNAAIEAIAAVAGNCPKICLGAGTVITIEQAKAAVGAGAKFIVSPGFDKEICGWCLENGIAVTPGCVTPTEIMSALAMGLNILKFFPANAYGGVPTINALAGPFGTVRFIPTGGVSGQNLAEYISSPYVHAVGGSWMCAKDDIAAGSYEKIATLCLEARDITLRTKGLRK